MFSNGFFAILTGLLQFVRIILKSFFSIFYSFGFILFLLIVLATGAGVATFVEKIYSTDVAKMLVYNAFWYEVVMVLLAICIIGTSIRFRLWKKPALFSLHIGFVVVLLGAGLTRYFGTESILHIREGETTNKALTSETYFEISSGQDNYLFKLSSADLHLKKFDKTVKIDNKPFHIKIISTKTMKSQAGEFLLLKLQISYQGTTQTHELFGSNKEKGTPIELIFGNKPVVISWGLSQTTLPFFVKLLDFELERYPGSNSASSYASEVAVIKGDSKMLFRIFMNNTLDYGGYRFFQVSYDTDEKGTLLTLNKDPGKLPTYLGYFLLSFGFLFGFFEKKSRFSSLRKLLKTAAVFGLLLCLNHTSLVANNTSAVINGTPSTKQEDLKQDLNQAPKQKDPVEAMKYFIDNSKELSATLESLLVQDPKGRIKPLGTLADEIVYKLSGKNKLFSMPSTQVLLGMLTSPNIWQTIPIIKVKHPRLKKLLGLKENENLMSFSQGFKKNKYLLFEDLQKANQKEPHLRDLFDKEIIKLDEKLNINFMVYSGAIFRVFPLPNDPNNTWYGVADVMSGAWNSQDKLVVQNDIVSFFTNMQEQDYKDAQESISQLQANQIKHASDIIPSAKKVQAELLFNKLEIFERLVGFYLLVGIVAFFYSIFTIFSQKEHRILLFGFTSLLTLGFIAHSIGLGLRWYVSGHAPWSDSYESLIYVAWASILAGLIFARKSTLTLSLTAVLAGIIMFVAHLSWIDPQITNLVPVLKSFWLTIHVSAITASYGFLGLGAILGLVLISLMLFRSSAKPYLDNEIKQLSAINEMSLTIGLALLTIGNFLGGVWANESWGRYWGWDPKETWSFVSIIVYVVVLHMRFIPPFRSVFAFNVASVFAFYSILMTYFGVNFYLNGLHSYAQGSPTGVDSYIFYSVGLIFILSLVAFFKNKKHPKLVI